MHWIVIVQMVLSFLYVAYLIYNYSLRSVSSFVKISVYFTWLICFSNVILLPFDVYYSLQSDYGMSVVWRTSYSLIFFLTWILLPIAQQYEEAGQFSIMEKLKRAIYNNLIIYGIFLLVGLIGLGTYLLVTRKFDLANLLPVLFAASNAFGMFLVVIFLSFGLTAIPRQLWRYKNYKVQLKKLQFDSSSLMQKKNVILQQLELRVKQILWKVKSDGQSLQTNQILRIVPKQYTQKWGKKVPDLGQVNVVKLNKQIKNLVLELNRLDSRWDEISIRAFKIQDILTYSNSHSKRLESTIFKHYNYQILNFLQWFWYCRAKKVILPIFSILLTLFAVVIIIAQISVFIPAISFFNPFVHLTKINQFVWQDLFLLIVLGYMAFCIYYALFKLRFSNYYGLYWNRQTDAASLIFFAINCSRVATPLNYNFLQIINDNNTSFVKATGQVPLIGRTLQIIFPVLIIILIIFNAFDVYSRICKRVGLNKFQFQVQFSHENIEEGRKLLQKSRADLETKILNSNQAINLNFQAIPAPSIQQQIKKESSSSDSLQLKPNYFNQYRNMDQVLKILQM